MNDEQFTLDHSSRVVVTGAAGFIGSAVVRALSARGIHVTAVLEPNAARSNLEGLDVELVTADITNATALRGIFDDAKYCFHLAAKFGFWPNDPEPFYRVNVDGTRNVITTALEAGVKRICYTSSVATLGLKRTKDGIASRESDYADVAHLHGNYKQSKYVAEHEVLRFAAEGAPLVLVLPTMPHGPFDHRPTPSGKVVLDYLRGKMPGYVDTAMNVAHVDDLAEGHLLALQLGRQGRSYICGGENLSMKALLDVLSAVTGLPRSDRSFPSFLPLAAGHLSQFVEGTLLKREPRVPLEAAHMAATMMTFNDDRARDELGYVSRPASHALYDSARWFVDNGYVESSREQLLRWNAPSA